MLTRTVIFEAGLGQSKEDCLRWARRRLMWLNLWGLRNILFGENARGMLLYNEETYEVTTGERLTRRDLENWYFLIKEFRVFKKRS